MSLRVDELFALKYIGSKRRMAGVLASMVPTSCTTYVEPFCGSAAVALAVGGRNLVRMVLNDLNAHIANFWRVASSPELSPLLLAALSKTQYSQTLFNEAKARKKTFGANRSDLVGWAVDTYVMNWQSFNGASEYWRYDDPEPYREHIIAATKLPLVFSTLCKRNTVEVHNSNALDLLTEGGFLEDEHAFSFLDPPYAEGLRCDGRLYEVDMGDARDHIDLLNTIKQAKAKIVLSGYWSGKDDGTDLYDYYLLPHGWHRHLLGEYTKSMKSTEEKDKGAEWVWCNYEIPQIAVNHLASYNDEQKSPALMAWLNGLRERGEAV